MSYCVTMEILDKHMVTSWQIKKRLFMYAVCIQVYIWTHVLSEAARGVKFKNEIWIASTITQLHYILAI